MMKSMRIARKSERSRRSFSRTLLNLLKTITKRALEEKKILSLDKIPTRIRPCKIPLKTTILKKKNKKYFAWKKISPCCPETRSKMNLPR